MTPSDSATNFITRRDFMKKSALTVGAITLLSQGIGLASGSGGGSGISGSPIHYYDEKSTAFSFSAPVEADSEFEAMGSWASQIYYTLPDPALEVWEFTGNYIDRPYFWGSTGTVTAILIADGPDAGKYMVTVSGITIVRHYWVTKVG